MKITMVAVCSADGFLTRGDDSKVSHWASDEDQAHFLQLIHEHKALVMGRTTYEVAHSKPEAERLRVVLTRSPELFADQAVAGQLEFHSETPEALVASLEKRGYEALLLLGGGHVNSEFLDAGLVNELSLTIEPVLFGSGVPLVDTLKNMTDLQLVSSQQLNDKGTLLLRYKIA